MSNMKLALNHKKMHNMSDAVYISMERRELHTSIKSMSCKLRGIMDGGHFKKCVLALLFYRYASEAMSGYGINGVDFAALDDEAAEYVRDLLVQERGFFIPPSQLFEKVYKNAAMDNDLAKTLKNIFNGIENSAKGTPSEHALKGIFSDFHLDGEQTGPTIEQRNKTMLDLIDRIGKLKLGRIFKLFL